MEALELQLKACADRAGVDKMIVADEDGIVVAANTICGWCDDVAALMPYLTRGGRFAGMLLDEGSVGRPVSVRPFKALGDRLFVCAVGRLGERVDDELDMAASGVRRILN